MCSADTVVAGQRTDKMGVILIMSQDLGSVKENLKTEHSITAETHMFPTNPVCVCSMAQ